MYGVADGSTLFTPKFQYSYQCSASLLSNYAYVNVFDLIIRGFLQPFIIMIAYSFSGDSYDDMNIIMKLIIPNTLKPLKVSIKNNYSNMKQENMIDSANSNENNIISSSQLNEDCGVTVVNNNNNNNNNNRMISTCWQEDISKPHSAVIDVDESVLGLTSSITILMTYGAIFPPMASVALACIYSESYFLQMKIGRFVTELTKIIIINVQNKNNISNDPAGTITTTDNDKIQNEDNNNNNNNNNNNSISFFSVVVCRILPEELNKLIITIGYLIWPIFYITGFFYSFFIFDTYGFGKNVDKALIASIFVTLLPFLIKICLNMIEWFLLYHHNNKGKQADESTLPKNNNNDDINTNIIIISDDNNHDLYNNNNYNNNNNNNNNSNSNNSNRYDIESHHVVISPLSQSPLSENKREDSIEMSSFNVAFM
eukprot:gene6391-8804_t